MYRVCYVLSYDFLQQLCLLRSHTCVKVDDLSARKRQNPELQTRTPAEASSGKLRCMIVLHALSLVVLEIEKMRMRKSGRNVPSRHRQNASKRTEKLIHNVLFESRSGIKRKGFHKVGFVIP